MSTGIDAVEERIKRLEKFVLGKDALRQDDEQLIETVLAVSRKLASVVSKNEKVSSALKRVEEIEKYSDPLYAESDEFIPESVKLQLVVSKEQEIKEAADHFQELNLLKSVIDSQAILDVPNIESRLNKIVSQQHNQEGKVSNLTHDTYELINNYSNFVNEVSKKISEMEKAVSKIDSSKK